MRKITVLDFCSRIGIASDEIPVVVKAGINIVGRYRSLYKLTAQAMPDLLEAKVQPRHEKKSSFKLLSRTSARNDHNRI